MFKEKKRTEISYAHPYCSRKRGTNESNNRINNYPRAMFECKSSNMILCRYINCIK